MLRLPTYEEACGISTPSPTGGETLERGHSGAAGVSGWQPASSFAAGAKSKVLKVAKVIKTAISAAFSSPPDSPLEELYDFPNVLPGQVGLLPFSKIEGCISIRCSLAHC